MALSSSFWFVIPLRSRATSKDWDLVCQLLRNSLASILNQTNPDFRVVISCADVPDLGSIVDDRIEIISNAYPVPHDFLAMALDKRAKKRAAGAEIGRRGGGYVMLVDADDLVSARIVEHVLSDDNRQGYYVENGFAYYSHSHRLEPLQEFYKKCGSCYVV